MEKKKDLLYEKFKDRCSDNGMTGEESGDIEMCWIIARDILTQERKQELDKAREEGARDVFTKDEWFMLKLAMNDIFNGGNRAYEDISNKIKSQLSKLTTK